MLYLQDLSVRHSAIPVAMVMTQFGTWVAGHLSARIRRHYDPAETHRHSITLHKTWSSKPPLPQFHISHIAKSLPQLYGPADALRAVMASRTPVFCPVFMKTSALSPLKDASQTVSSVMHLQLRFSKHSQDLSNPLWSHVCTCPHQLQPAELTRHLQHTTQGPAKHTHVLDEWQNQYASQRPNS